MYYTEVKKFVIGPPYIDGTYTLLITLLQKQRYMNVLEPVIKDFLLQWEVNNA
jgi:hypothetical protein